MLLDELRLVLVLIGQHHITFVVSHLVGSGCPFIRIDHAASASVAVTDVHDAGAGVVRGHRLPVDDDVLQSQLCGNLSILQVFKQQLVIGAGSGEHVICLHGDVWQGEGRLTIRIHHGHFPKLIQLLRLHHAHGHADGLFIQRPARAPQRPVELLGDKEDLNLQSQFDLHIDADLQIQRARVVASAS